jgi:hypothetical protein
LLGEFNASFSHFSATFTIISACFSLFFSSLKTSGECQDRSIQLCRMLRDGAGERLKEIENSLIEAIKGPTNDDDLVLWASDLLSKYKLGHLIFRQQNLALCEDLQFDHQHHISLLVLSGYFCISRVFLQFEVSLIFDPCMTGLNYRFLFECFPRYYIVMMVVKRF